MIFDDKNIVCNDCAGARIYEQLNRQFSCPFVWNIIHPEDFINLCKFWDEINFNNIQIIHDQKLDIYGLRIDDLVNVYYPHYKKDESSQTSRKQGVDVFYKDIEKYIIDKFQSRISRMKNDTVFILDFDSNFGSVYKPEHVREFLQIKDREKIVSSIDIPELNNMIDVKFDPKNRLNSGERAKQILQKYGY